MSALQLDERGVLAPCNACGKRNRLGFAHLGRSTRCGHCRTVLAAPSEPIEVTSAPLFDALVRDSALPVVVDFWAPWCGPCRMVAPELEKVARTLGGEFLIVKVDTDAVPALGERHRIRSIPTMAVFYRGREITRTSGARPAPAIEAFVRGALTATT